MVMTKKEMMKRIWIYRILLLSNFLDVSMYAQQKPLLEQTNRQLRALCEDLRRMYKIGIRGRINETIEN